MRSNVRLNYRKLAMALAIVAIALLQTLYQAPSARPLARTAAADLTTEKLTLSSFADGLTSLEKKVAELQRKSSITSTELNSTKTSASTLKTRVSQVQQTFQSVINKLKAAGEWENFDNVVLKETNDSNMQSIINNNGGAKVILQDLASQLSGLSTEIDALIQPLTIKVASTGFSFGNSRALGFMPVRASYAPAVTIFKDSLKCRFRTAQRIINPTQDNKDRATCACNTCEFTASLPLTCPQCQTN